MARNSSALDAIAALAVEEHKAAPCAVVACAHRSEGGWAIGEGAYGALEPGGTPATVDTIFDLASVTKPFSALALARLIRREFLSWNTELGVLLRDVHGTPSVKTTLELLVSHRAGLEGHRPLYAPLEQGKHVDRFSSLQVAGAARRRECEGEAPDLEGFPPVYSDLGYLLLGEAMSRATGMPFDELVEREVCEPLGIEATSARRWFPRVPTFFERVAPTEDIGWRGGVIRGAVHDENAWALSGHGLSAHAGLFGVARDVAKLGVAVLDVLAGRRDDWLSARDVEPLVRVRPGGTLRAGFDGKSGEGSSAGRLCSGATFGHLGFTGTSLWLDPASEVVTVLLTNRVHPTRTHELIKVARPVVHDALFAWGQARSGK